MADRDFLRIVVVYERPTDVPQYTYVVREWRVVAGTEEQVCLVAYGFNELDEARSFIRSKWPDSCMRVPRGPDEDPVILESYL